MARRIRTPETEAAATEQLDERAARRAARRLGARIALTAWPFEFDREKLAKLRERAAAAADPAHGFELLIEGILDLHPEFAHFPVIERYASRRGGR